MMLQHGLSEDSSYTVNQSLRFRASNDGYLERTFITATNRNLFTFSGWVKKSTVDGVVRPIFSAGYDDNNKGLLRFDTSGHLEFISIAGGVTRGNIYSSAVYRDVSAHYHIQMVCNFSDATSSNRVKLYVNGFLVSIIPVVAVTGANQHIFNTITSHRFGRGFATVQKLDGYLSEINFVDGQALEPSSFGQTDPATGIWVPKKYTGTYGANGFYLPFNDATSLTTLGYDRSGNGNNWTCNGISITAGTTYDVMKDSPTNSGDKGNYATLNPLYPSRSTLTNGNLTASGSTDLPTIMPDSGTWYFEIDGVSKTWTPPAAFPAAAGNYNFGQRPFTNTATYPTLHTGTLTDATPVTTSGTFTGNASTDGPCIFINGTPTAMTINSNAVTFATHADKLAGGFKVRSSSASYNASGTNTYSITTNGGKFKYARAQANP